MDAFVFWLKSDEGKALYVENYMQMIGLYNENRRYEPRRKTQQRSEHLALYDTSTGNMISRFLRDKYRKHDSSRSTREVQEMRYLGVDGYEYEY